MCGEAITIGCYDESTRSLVESFPDDLSPFRQGRVAFGIIT
ncbi:Uncharacterised protein [Corynebacterium matruchotii]|uniref:Uncharacterized protein n=1 Tax=Corynebacterium matruchotii TaxID=43768 RepID=A0A8B4H886_9CORY|nr:Uncharacterised protein [Corynebacterium matruchotii]